MTEFTERMLLNQKIRIVLEGLRGEESIAELCRREGDANLGNFQSLTIPIALVAKTAA